MSEDILSFNFGHENISIFLNGKLVGDALRLSWGSGKAYADLNVPDDIEEDVRNALDTDGWVEEFFE